MLKGLAVRQPNNLRVIDEDEDYIGLLPIDDLLEIEKPEEDVKLEVNLDVEAEELADLLEQKFKLSQKSLKFLKTLKTHKMKMN